MSAEITNNEQTTIEETVEVVDTPTNETVVETEQETKPTVEAKPEKGYVAHRVERAEQRTQKQILNELGVDDLDSAKEALKRVAILEEKLQKQEALELQRAKENAIITLLDSEKAFDSEALMLFVDLDTVTIGADGNIVDGQGIVDALKNKKPNFFGVVTKESANHVEGQTTQPNTALEKQKAGDLIGAIAQDLTNQLKR